MKYITSKLIIALLFTSWSAMLYGQVQIEGLYATSTALPFSKHAIQNVFDGDSTTYWKTPQGAGPDEGIMIYFAKPTYISKIEINTFQGPDISTINRFELYGDGRSFWGTEPETVLNSIYLKISSTKNTEQIKSEIDGKKYARSKFDSSLSVGISEISIYGADGIKLDVLTPETVNGTITASTSLKPALAYGAGNIMDFKKEVSWAEGNANDGTGESITFATASDITISSLKIWNGYQRSPKHFTANSRAKNIQFGIKGSTLSSYQVEDLNLPQSITLNTPITGKEFILIIEEIYPGEKYSDLVISEIRFFSGVQPIHINTATEEKRVQENLQNDHLILGQFLNQNVNVSLWKESHREKEGESFSESYWNMQSLILRANNTFVLYHTEASSIEEYRESDNYENFQDESKEVIAEGNWEIKAEGLDYVKVRIFGKIYSPTTQAELYHGDVSSANVRIFQDNLTLTKDKISGERFVEDIIIKN